MASISRQLLSASTNGRPIQVAATSSTGTTIHTAVTGTTSIDEVHLWAVNNSTSDVLLTIEHGGTGEQNEIKFLIPAQVGLVELGGKLVLQNGLLIRAYAGTTNVLNISGYVNRIS
jgi:hypothetical protein